MLVHDQSFATWYARNTSSLSAQGAHRGVVLTLTSHSGRQSEHRLHAASTLGDQYSQISARYMAAAVNNVAMIEGAISFTLRGDDQLVHLISEILDERYSQVHRLSQLMREAITDNADYCEPWATAIPVKPRNATIGINIGQSYIKAVAITHGEVVRRVIARTHDGKGTPGERICTNARRVVRSLQAAAPQAVAVGLAVGGIVLGGQIFPESGVTLALNPDDYLAVSGLAKALEGEIGLPVLTAQDVRSKAYFHSASQEVKQCLVVDLGTSLGGAYVDAQGAIPDLLNQVGRLVCNLSDDAPSRGDGLGRGLLSQCVSATGTIAEAIRQGVEIDEPLDLEPRVGTSDRGVDRLIGAMRARTIEMLNILQIYYELRSVVVTGGLLNGRFGNAVLPANGEISDHLSILRSVEPQFDAAIGVGWAAAQLHVN